MTYSINRRPIAFTLLLTGMLGTNGVCRDAIAASDDALETRARWTRAATAQTQLPAHVTQSLRPQDVIAYAAPGVLVPRDNIGLQCQGASATLANIPQRSASVQTAEGRAAPRFGEAEFDGVQVFRLEASAYDILPSGSSARCELISYPMPNYALPSGEVFWWAMSFWAGDWSASQDEQLIAQFHVQEPRNLLLNPFFALVVRGNALRVELRHNTNAVPSRETTRLVTPASLPMPVKKWVTAVVQARMTTDTAQAPFLRLWIDGNLVADYTGPLGYVLPPGGLAYVKAGIYHWLAGNDWDTTVPTRTMLIGAMLTARDGTGRYSTAQLAATVKPLLSR